MQFVIRRSKIILLLCMSLLDMTSSIYGFRPFSAARSYIISCSAEFALPLYELESTLYEIALTFNKLESTLYELVLT